MDGLRHEALIFKLRFVTTGAIGCDIHISKSALFSDLSLRAMSDSRAQQE
jgi:hypothetical protein